MGEILKKIQFDPEYVKTREEINQKIVGKIGIPIKNSMI
ncbi:hypothetical protein HMPREF9466_02534 [Fusobacterium necrophorum subsp. funduliforme 1_1_36S]|nr:hypothetical protein HMPREF9466_02534 [Fusobacterium necrophorum subsp. funduliforme 1_1_36S]